MSATLFTYVASSKVSNHCVRHCHYCGLRAGRQIPRYRMSADEIVRCAHQAHGLGFGTVVLQSGEDFGIQAGWMAKVISRIKDETPLAVTLSLGERLPKELRLWRRSGADRYLLRFETSDPVLYAAVTRVEVLLLANASRNYCSCGRWDTRLVAVLWSDCQARVLPRWLVT